MIEKSIFFVGAFIPSANNPAPSEYLSAKLSEKGWSVLKISSYRNGIIRGLDIVTNLILKKGDYVVCHIDLFSGYAFIWGLAAAFLAKFFKKPYIVTLHGGNLPVFSKGWRWALETMVRHATEITAPSQYLICEMQKYARDKEIKLIPNPVLNSNFDFRLRSEIQPSIIWLRRFRSVYHPCLAVELMARLVKSYDDLNLTMVGSDSGDGSVKKVERLKTKYGLSNNVQIIKGIPNSEVPSYLRKADIFINTTNIDNTPVSVIEAMACGLCVVSTNVGGIPYLLEHEKDALLVPPNDADQMSLAIERLLSEPLLAQKLSENARKKAEQFDWAIIFPKWEALLESVISDQ